MKPLIVFDLDGVLANIDHRVAYIDCDEPDWTRFYAPKEVAKDVPIKPLIAVYRHLCSIAHVEIWTGRQKSSQLITHQWLKKHAGVLPAAMRMRPNDNRLSNLDLKRQFLQESPRKPAMVYDAQPNTSEFWHKRGILVCYTVHP